MLIDRKHYVFGLKALLSVVFVVIIVRAVDLEEMALRFRSLDLKYVIALLFLSFLVIVVSCLKWQILLKVKGLSVSIRYLVSLYLLGYFFNNFLPSMVGGDLARGYFLGKRLGNRRDAYLSVFIERLTGLLALSIMAIIVVFVDHPAVRQGGLRWPLIATACGSMIGIAIVFSRRLFRLCLSVVPARFSGARGKMDKIHKALCEFNGSKRVFVQVMGLSLLFHVLAGINLYCACLALRYEVMLLDMILVTPLIILVSLIPITVNGVGLWEGSFIVFFALLGIPAPVAISAALLLRAKNLLVSALGGLVYWGESKGAMVELKKNAQEEGFV